MNQSRALTKMVKRYGNSGGVYLPSSWVGGEVEISLVARPPRPERDLPLALGDRMRHVVSILIFGSHARGEQTAESDIDVIIVTDSHAKDMKVPQELKAMNYDIRVMSRDEVIRIAKRDILLSESLMGSRAIFNDSFLDELKSLKRPKISQDRIEFARSSLDIIKSMFEMGGDNSSLVYPIMMRIKEMLLLKCILENKRYSLRLLESYVRKRGISGSDFRMLMGNYRAVRDGRKPKKQELGERVFSQLIKILEELIIGAEKKEKA